LQRSVLSALILIIFCRFSSSSCSSFPKGSTCLKNDFLFFILQDEWNHRTFFKFSLKKKNFFFSCRKKFNAQLLMKWILRGFTCKEDRLIKFPSFRLKNMEKKKENFLVKQNFWDRIASYHVAIFWYIWYLIVCLRRYSWQLMVGRDKIVILKVYSNIIILSKLWWVRWWSQFTLVDVILIFKRIILRSWIIEEFGALLTALIEHFWSKLEDSRIFFIKFERKYF